MEAQTDDYNGYFARLWAWFCERFLNRNGSENANDFFTNDQNELSFGKKREGDEESMRSSGTFGGKFKKQDSDGEKDLDGDQLALKTLKLNIDDKNKHDNQRENSPNKSDIFNKSAVGDNNQNTD